MTVKDVWNIVKGTWSNRYDPEELESYLNQVSAGDYVYKNPEERNEAAVADLLGKMNSEGVNPVEIQGQLATSGLSMNPQQEEYLSNAVAQYNTHSAQNFEEHMRDTDLTSSASQLQALGLSPSSVVDTSLGHNAVNAASSKGLNAAENAYDRKQAIARSLISMASSMASAGIYGSSLGLVRSFAGKLASSSAHSALKASQFGHSAWSQHLIDLGYDSNGV